MISSPAFRLSPILKVCQSKDYQQIDQGHQANQGLHGPEGVIRRRFLFYRLSEKPRRMQAAEDAEKENRHREYRQCVTRDCEREPLKIDTDLSSEDCWKLSGLR